MIRDRRPTLLLARAFRNRIVRNAFALYWVQFGMFVVPLVTLPYLTRVLGQRPLGTVIFAQSFSNLLGLILDFGFNQSATRDVAIARDDPDRLSSIVSGVFGAKVLLAAAALAPVLVGVVSIPTLRANPEYGLLAWLAAVASGFTPTWFFLGRERVRTAALIQLGARVVAAVLTFVLVHRSTDGWIVLALTAASGGLGAVALTIRMYRQVEARRPRGPETVEALRRGWRLFISTAAISFYTTANVVILGLFVPAAQVALFGVAERVVRAATQLFGPVAAAVYPRLAYLQSAGARGRARRLARAALAALFATGLAGAALLALLAPEIIRILFGYEFADAVPILRILCIIVPLIAYSTVLGAGWMLSLEMDRQLVRTVLLGAALNIATALVVAPVFGAIGMAWTVVLAELAVAVGLTAAVLQRDRTMPETTFFRRPRRHLNI